MRQLYVLVLSVLVMTCGRAEKQTAFHDVGSGDLIVKSNLNIGVADALRSLFASYLQQDVCVVRADAPAGHGLYFGSCPYIKSLQTETNIPSGDVKGVFLLIDNNTHQLPNGVLMARNGEHWVGVGESNLYVPSHGDIGSLVNMLCTQTYADVCDVKVDNKGVFAVAFK